jgi:hypothetical protein
MFCVFHYLFQWKMSEKQTTFFTINCAEKLEPPNQCETLIDQRNPIWLLVSKGTRCTYTLLQRCTEQQEKKSICLRGTPKNAWATHPMRKRYGLRKGNQTNACASKKRSQNLCCCGSAIVGSRTEPTKVSLDRLAHGSATAQAQNDEVPNLTTLLWDVAWVHPWVTWHALHALHCGFYI